MILVKRVSLLLVIPAQAGIALAVAFAKNKSDSRLRGNDEQKK
ncbi:MAG: hypothetical protein QM769_02230 [Pseudoxanthomonas sp.]